jgi:hypothetical protein
MDSEPVKPAIPVLEQKSRPIVDHDLRRQLKLWFSLEDCGK